MLRVTFFLGVVAAGYVLVQVGDVVPSPQDYSGVPLHQLSRDQLDRYLRYLAGSGLTPAARLERLAVQDVGQPHREAVLGEGTYDAHDPRPLYALDRSDNVSFVAQMLAMSVAQDFETFFLVLQRLRYQGGQVATASRNHNLLSDWARNNGWLLDDVTEQLAGGMAWVPVHQIVRKATLLRDRFAIASGVPDEKFIGSCVPRVYLYKVLPELHVGDVVLFVTGNDRQQYSEEMGLILNDPSDANEPLRLVWSHDPAVDKTNFRETIRQRRDIMGFKFLRLRPNAAEAAAGAAAEMRGRLSIP